MRDDIASKIEEVARRVAGSEGLELVEVEVKGGGNNRLVRIAIDKPEGVTHGDCELVSHQVGTILDVEDVVPGRYTLEVSSPGVERKLLKPQDYERFQGKKAKITLRDAVEGRRNWEGILAGLAGGVVMVETEPGKTRQFPIEQIQKANLKFEWKARRTRTNTANKSLLGYEEGILDTIFQSIEILSKEKGIDPQIVFDAVKDAMLIAARKHYRTNEDYIADMDPKSGAIKLYAVKKVVEAVEDPVHEMTLAEAYRIDKTAEIGAEVKIPKNTDALGRISAQTAKQVIFQKVREAERETVFNEYSGRAGELVNCTIKRVEGPDYILDLGKTEAKLPKKEQSRLESYSVGDRVRCVIKLVDKSSKGPGVLVSRAAPELVMRLFEQEVPEIYDSTVQIKGCAREAGERTKIAVQSRDRDVDSVGACVGMKGMRVQSIIRELRGEKIDIIEYSDDSVVFATHALSPAKVSRITILDPLERHMEVIVDDSQLSLAIGKKGQNVRLAAKLLGWKIDIKSEEEKRQEVESQMAALVAPGAPVGVLLEYGLAEAITEKLLEGGIGTIEKLGAMTPEQLDELGIGEDLVRQIQDAVNLYYGQFEQPAGEAIPSGEPESIPVEEPESISVEEPESVPVEIDAAPETDETPLEPANDEAAAQAQSDTMDDAGSPHNQSEGTGSQEHPEE